MPNAAAPATDGPDRTEAPLHVAIIMDGNGRWAAARGLPRAEGHRRGVEALRRVVRAAGELGILYLTIFSFSSENWSRPATEIGDLFGLLRRFIRNDLATRSEEHTSELQSRLVISYAVFCLKKKKKNKINTSYTLPTKKKKKK